MNEFTCHQNCKFCIAILIIVSYFEPIDICKNFVHAYKPPASLYSMCGLLMFIVIQTIIARFRFSYEPSYVALYRRVLYISQITVLYYAFFVVICQFINMHVLIIIIYGLYYRHAVGHGRRSWGTLNHFSIFVFYKLIGTGIFEAGAISRMF